jgi:hypothetical protein
VPYPFDQLQEMVAAVHVTGSRALEQRQRTAALLDSARFEVEDVDGSRKFFRAGTSGSELTASQRGQYFHECHLAGFDPYSRVSPERVYSPRGLPEVLDHHTH